MRTFLLAVLALAAAAFAGPGALAQAPQVLTTEQVESRLVSSRAAVAPGETFTIALRQDFKPPWHTYWVNAGDSGEPIEITWREDGYTAGPLRHPAPVLHSLEVLMTYVHEGEVLFPVEITVPAGAPVGRDLTLTADIYYLVCSDICLTEQGIVSLTLPVQAAGADDPEWGPRLEAAVASLPRDAGLDARITGGDPAQLSISGEALAAITREGRIRDLYFFPFSRDVIVHLEPQAASYGAQGATLSLKAGAANNLGEVPLDGIIAFDEQTASGWVRRAYAVRAVPGEALAGTSGTPVPSAGSGESGADSGGGGAAPMSFGMAMLFALLGGLILNVMPCVLPVLAIKAVGIAQSAHEGRTRRHGLLYAAGVLTMFLALAAIIIALRSAGEALGWAFQLQEPWLVAALALLFFGIGLNLVGVFEIGGGAGVGQSLVARGGDAGAFFTGLLAVVAASPCVGPFMAGATGFAFANPAPVTLAVFAALAIGFALPIVALSFAPGLQKLIPKPGAWMTRFKQILGFAMFGAAVWLAWILIVQTGPMGALALLSVFVAAGFLALALNWGRLWTIAALILLIGVGVMAWRPLTTLAPAGGSASSESALAFEPWSAERVQALRAEGRPVFVNFTAAWCVQCQVNELTTLRGARVAAAFEAANVAYLKADWTTPDDAIAAELARHGRAGVPLYLYYAPGAERPVVLPQVLSERVVIDAVAPGS